MTLTPYNSLRMSQTEVGLVIKPSYYVHMGVSHIWESMVIKHTIRDRLTKHVIYLRTLVTRTVGDLETNQVKRVRRLVRHTLCGSMTTVILRGTGVTPVTFITTHLTYYYYYYY